MSTKEKAAVITDLILSAIVTLVLLIPIVRELWHRWVV